MWYLDFSWVLLYILYLGTSRAINSINMATSCTCCKVQSAQFMAIYSKKNNNIYIIMYSRWKILYYWWFHSGVQDNLIPPLIVNDGRIHLYATGNLSMHIEVSAIIRTNQLMDNYFAWSRSFYCKDSMKESKLLSTNLNSSRLSMATGYSFLWFLKPTKQYKNIY